jgi:hypothetical protein
MSTFNVVVPPHKLAPWLLRSINWGQPDDPEKKYPLMGRMRYVWTDEDKNVKILLKDGPSSWSEEKDELMSQIENHETFVGVEILERDPVYIIATFKPVMETSYDRGFPVDEFIENLEMFDKTAMEVGSPSIMTHPFDLWDKAMEDMKNGKTTPKMDKLAENLKAMFEEDKVQDNLKEIVKEAGIDGLDKPKVRVMMVGPDGSLNDKTDDFVKPE